jgi:hypothetical protein
MSARRAAKNSTEEARQQEQAKQQQVLSWATIPDDVIATSATEKSVTRPSVCPRTTFLLATTTRGQGSRGSFRENFVGVCPRRCVHRKREGSSPWLRVSPSMVNPWQKSKRNCRAAATWAATEQQPLAASKNNSKDRRRETDFPEDRRDESDDEGEGGAKKERRKKVASFSPVPSCVHPLCVSLWVCVSFCLDSKRHPHTISTG